MKVFEFKQIESGSNFRIEIDYHHYMQKQTAWLDGDILEMGEKPLESVNARLYVDDELEIFIKCCKRIWVEIIRGHTNHKRVQSKDCACPEIGDY